MSQQTPKIPKGWGCSSEAPIDFELIRLNEEKAKMEESCGRRYRVIVQKVPCCGYVTNQTDYRFFLPECIGSAVYGILGCTCPAPVPIRRQSKPASGGGRK